MRTEEHELRIEGAWCNARAVVPAVPDGHAVRRRTGGRSAHEATISTVNAIGTITWNAPAPRSPHAA